MKFLIDAQLPRRLVYRLREAGYEAIHTLDLPEGKNLISRNIVRVFCWPFLFEIFEYGDYLNDLKK